MSKKIIFRDEFTERWMEKLHDEIYTLRKDKHRLEEFLADRACTMQKLETENKILKELLISEDGRDTEFVYRNGKAYRITNVSIHEGDNDRYNTMTVFTEKIGMDLPDEVESIVAKAIRKKV